MELLDQAVGEALRRARRRRGMTLNDVQTRSMGRFKPSALGGYERADRKIPLERFCELAEIYGIAASLLLTEALEITKGIAPHERRAVIILDRLTQIPAESRGPLREFVDEVKSLRGDYLTEVITVRASDLTGLAVSAGITPQTFLRQISPALRA